MTMKYININLGVIIVCFVTNNKLTIKTRITTSKSSELLNSLTLLELQSRDAPCKFYLHEFLNQMSKKSPYQ